MGHPNRVHGEKKIRPSWHEVRVRGWPIGYETVGEGEPVVMVHGLSGSTRWWSRNVQAVAERHRIYLVDLPGFGIMQACGADSSLPKPLRGSRNGWRL
jgi:hypothetical protein